MAAIPGAQWAVHAHDDIGTAVASSILAVQCGVGQVQGTLLGIGERCGSNLSTIIGASNEARL